ncbi:MAG: DUF2937 family protein [Alphaproteobacteria bacterium]
MFSRLISGIFGTIGAVSLMQFPAFFQQYLQRLGGHLEQAKLDVGRFVEAAKLQGLDLKTYINRLSENADETVVGTADAIKGVVDDLDNHQQAFSALQSSAIWQQPASFARWVNSNISTDTFAIFEPSLPLSTAGLIYGLIGLILGVSLLSLIGFSWRLVKNIFKRLHANSLMRA